ncbi:SDR family oxidoreductase, partial [archaeon]
FQFFQRDVVEDFVVEIDQIYHLACPASPPHYQYNMIKTIKTSTLGTANMLGLAKRTRSRLLLASTSEIYGDPQVHPQAETYWGNVNTLGPRSCYDEGKRVAETMCFAYSREGHVDVRIARIFNTYGPRMHPNDGRVVSNFIIQALQGRPLTVYGEGGQTRSFQFVSDLVTGLIKLMNSDYPLNPVNLGNPVESTVLDFATKVRDLINPSLEIKKLPPTKDDPKKRKPDITVAGKVLKWEPRVTLEVGLHHTVNYFSDELGLKRPEFTTKNTGVEFVLKDVAPLWTASLINDALTDVEKGYVAPKEEDLRPE